MGNGWTPARRARQAALIHNWKPWAQSTGPKTGEGKSASSMNAHKHGLRGREWLEMVRDVNDYVRRCKKLIDEK